MNKYLLPIYHSKLKPWIKYWLYKHTGKVPVPVLSDWTEGYSPIEIPNAFPDTTLQDLSLIGNTLQLGTPTPTNPVPVKTVSGTNTITLNNTSNYKVDLKSKNLFDRANAEENKGLVWTTGATFNDTNSIVSDYITAEIGQDYKFNYNGGIFFYDSNKDYLGALQSGGTTIDKTTGTTTTTFAVPNVSEIKYMRIAFRSSFNNSTNMVTANIMVNKGTTALPYEPYYNYELCKIGDYQDKIYKENDKWYIEKNIKKLVLNGSETGWDVKNSGTVNWLYEISNSSLIPTAASQSNQLSNRYLNDEIYNGNTNTGIMVLNSGHALRIRYGTEDTANNFKTWLASNNVIVYYQLAVPTTTEITSGTTLYSELESIVTDMKLTSGNNKLTQTNADLPFYLLFKYYMKG